MKNSVYIIDPNPLARLMLERLLATEKIASVGEAGDCVSGATGLALTGAPIVIVDPYNIPAHLKGATAIRHITERNPAVKCVVFTQNPPDVFATKAIAAGAVAYVSKAMPHSLVDVIRNIFSGQLMTELIIYPVEANDSDPLLVLTPRQLETLVFTGFGYKTIEISKQIGVSVKTVETFKLTIKRKLQIPHHVALATFAAKWLDLNPLLRRGVSVISKQ